jgi:RsiW-degrading membrane proteinase PrsW (M82 family)
MNLPASVALPLARAGISILPVLAFLACLVLLDSFKLTPLRRVAGAIAAGCAAAVVSYVVSGWWLGRWDRPLGSLTVAPPVEEILKAVFIWWLLRTGRIGFMVEGAIYGFAVGAGFAAAENIVYLGFLSGASLYVSILRGFGTAVMHGGATAIVGILAAGWVHRRTWTGIAAFAGGLIIATAVHIFYNSPLLPPVPSVCVVLVGVPALMAAIFMRSEYALERWMGEGFDADLELLDLISSGRFGETHAGQYLQSLRDSFPAPVVADMLCLLQISAELAVRAKAELLKREAGLASGPDAEVTGRLEELQHLEDNLGPTGRLALAPLLAARSRRLWQLRQLMLSQSG